MSVDQATGVVTGNGGGNFVYGDFDAPITATRVRASSSTRLCRRL